MLAFSAPDARAESHEPNEHSASPSAADPSAGGGQADHGHHVHPGSEGDEMAPAAASPESIDQLDSLWSLPDGSRIRLGALAGRVQVLAMVYTHCTHACPRIIADMRSIRSRLGESGDRVGYALVSLDPKRDDVERLGKFRTKTGLGEGRTLMRADEGSVREFAVVLGIRDRRVSDEDFIHSNVISALDPEGVLVHRQSGLGADPEESVAAIREFLKSEPAAAAWD
jgi:protein SCO1/2